MSDVFISYAREDKPKAELFAKALGRQGLSVWWDRNIPPGKSYGQVIAQALDSAKCVVVLWSREAVVSDWVKDEAAAGKRRGVLVPALIQDVTPPIGFGQLQTANLVRWKGDGAYPEFQQFLDAVCTHVGCAPPPCAREAFPAAPSFCINCGARLQAEDRFCVTCGKPVTR